MTSNTDYNIKTNSETENFTKNESIITNTEQVIDASTNQIYWINLSSSSNKTEPAECVSNKNKNEIFNEQQEIQSKYFSFDESLTWLKANFFLTDQRMLLGTWNGVFTSICLSVLGVIIFIRAGWMVANAGIIISLMIIFLTFLIALITLSSAIALCEKCKLNQYNYESNLSGGEFYLLSKALGVKVGVSIGLFYTFGQAVNSSFILTAFGESVCKTLRIEDGLSKYLSRAIGLTILAFALTITLMGIKWVNRFQRLILAILTASIFDFIIGSFRNFGKNIHGVTGYSKQNFENNLYPNYTGSINAFSVYGVFFPAMTGIFGGINIAYDLQKPNVNIPVGTYSGLIASTLIYTAVIFIYGSVALRPFLHKNFLIGEIISYFGFLFLIGFYVCTFSSTLSSFYAPSRLLYTIAKQDLLPKRFDFLKTVKGPNKMPASAILLLASITFIFIMIGEIYILAPIVSMPYMLIYAFINYAYFAIETTESEKKKQDLKQDTYENFTFKSLNLDSLEDKYHRNSTLKSQETVKAESNLNTFELVEPNSKNKMKDEILSKIYNQEDDSINKFYLSFFANKWLSLIGCILAIFSMIVINYIYALVSFVVCFLIYIQLRIYKPGLPSGIADLNLTKRLDSFIKKITDLFETPVTTQSSCCVKRKKSGKNEFNVIILTPVQMNFGIEQSQINFENMDYINRKPYHQYNNSKTLESDN